MKPIERYAWIEKYIRERNHSVSRYSVDVCDSYFVDAYIKATGASFKVRYYGAQGCKQLGRDLAEMVKRGRLRRRRTGLGDMHSMGFPAWVWSYHLPKPTEASPASPTT